MKLTDKEIALIQAMLCYEDDALCRLIDNLKPEVATCYAAANIDDSSDKSRHAFVFLNAAKTNLRKYRKDGKLIADLNKKLKQMRKLNQQGAQND